MAKLIEIEGIGYTNKGAELMLYAVVDQLRNEFGNHVQICCQPRKGVKDGYRLLGAKNILQLGHLTLKGYSLNWLINCLPTILTDTFGVSRSKDVDIILDASGLRYSDKWPHIVSQSVLTKYKRIKNRGKIIIMLPQAFGPFENSDVRNNVRDILKCSTLSFARDDISYNHLMHLCGKKNNILKAPDFTNLVEPLPHFDGSDFKDKVMIIPNQKMLDKADPVASKNYYNYILNVCEYLRNQGEKIIILNHEGEQDRLICEQLSKHFGNVPIVSHWDPVYIKTVIGCCKLLVSSRFHGCVSALSQGVPVIATSWHHKYEMLLKDYGVSELLVDLSSDIVDVSMIQTALLEETRNKILVRSLVQKRQTKEMWNSVFKLLSAERYGEK